MIKLKNILLETVELVTNYTVENSSEKASLVKIPYVDKKGVEKSITLWVPKSILEKNAGVPKWVIENYLVKNSFKSNINSILDTVGKTKSELNISKPKIKDLYFGIKNGFIKKIITAYNKEEAKSELKDLKVIKFINNMRLYVSNIDDRKLHNGKLEAVIDKNKGNTHFDGDYLIFNSRIYGKPSFSSDFRPDEANYRGEQRYFGGIKIGVDLGEVWEIRSVYKKYEKIDI
jgi:hypothetical protein